MARIWDATSFRAMLLPQGEHLLWTGSIDHLGTGYTRHGGKWISAPALAYTLLVGPIPEGQIVRHRCRQRLCCNPDHLRPRTRGEHLALLVKHGQARPIQEVRQRGKRGPDRRPRKPRADKGLPRPAVRMGH